MILKCLFFIKNMLFSLFRHSRSADIFKILDLQLNMPNPMGANTVWVLYCHQARCWWVLAMMSQGLVEEVYITTYHHNLHHHRGGGRGWSALPHNDHIGHCIGATFTFTGFSYPRIVIAFFISARGYMGKNRMDRIARAGRFGKSI